MTPGFQLTVSSLSFHQAPILSDSHVAQQVQQLFASGRFERMWARVSRINVRNTPAVETKALTHPDGHLAEWRHVPIPRPCKRPCNAGLASKKLQVHSRRTHEPHPLREGSR